MSRPKGRPRDCHAVARRPFYLLPGGSNLGGLMLAAGALAEALSVRQDPRMVRTRFAPSPTGYLHIGGVRTALFCWLFAKRHGGQFILRIDDTDAERNVESALAPILHGLHWLGIDWDEGPDIGGPHAPYYQSQRLAGYQAAAAKLLATGHAYRDYATPAEIQCRARRPKKKSDRFSTAGAGWPKRPPIATAFRSRRNALPSYSLKMPAKNWSSMILSEGASRI